MKIIVTKESVAVCRLSPDAEIPKWALLGAFVTVTRTSEEVSIVCEEVNVPAGIKVERGWQLLKVQGPLEFSMTGVLAAISKPLADAHIPIFAISTFDTDYLLVKEIDLARATEPLRVAGFEVA